ncbi:unnamed protein product [Sphagnum tenellum]
MSGGSWSGNVYTTGSISANCTVSFTATSVVFSGSTNQTISVASSSGSSVTLSVVAGNGYFNSATVTGTCSAGTWSGNSIRSPTVTPGCTVIFSTYTVTATGDGNETIVTSTSSYPAANQGKQSFTVTPSASYFTINAVYGTCPSGSWSGTTYTTGTFSAACTVIFGAVKAWNFTGALSTASASYYEGYDSLSGGLASDHSGNMVLAFYTDGNIETGLPTSDFIQDGAIVKYNSLGVQQWAKDINGSGGRGTGIDLHDVKIGSDGGIYVAGWTDVDLTTNAANSTGTEDAFIIKFDSSGNRLWSHQYGVSGTSAQFAELATDGLGNVYAAGYTGGDIGGGYIAGGGNTDAVVAKWNSSGTLQWIKDFGVSGLEADGVGIAEPYTSRETPLDSGTGTGSSTGRNDCYIVSYTDNGTTGTYNTAYQFGVSAALSDCFGSTVAITYDSSAVVISGQTNHFVGTSGSQIGIIDAFAGKFPLDLSAPTWITQVGVSGQSTQGLGIAVDALGKVAIGGQSDGDMATGSGAAPGGNEETFIKMFSSSGVPQ